LRDLAQKAETLMQAMEFDFLYDAHRHVFRIGYNVDAGMLDSNHYDLLASESRIANIIPEYDADSAVMLVRNPYSAEFGTCVAFLAASRTLHGLTADRAEFLGPGGRTARPAALDRLGLSGTVEAGLDPCGVLQVHFDFAPGASEEVSFLMGQGADRNDALRLAGMFRSAEHITRSGHPSTTTGTAS
jgi:cellobiose phosphorylase